MNDERFFDLAMKVIARQATDAERAELDVLLAGEPDLRAEFERLQADVQSAKDALPLVDATQATAGELPAYARGRLQTKVRETLGRPKTTDVSSVEQERSMMWAWRWALGLAVATAVIVLVLIPAFRTQPETVIQIAMLDTAGATRGSDTNEVALLQQSWNKATIDSFAEFQLLRAWETNWPAGTKADVVKIIYDRAAAEMRVLGRRGGSEFNKSFPVRNDLSFTINKVQKFVHEQTKR